MTFRCDHFFHLKYYLNYHLIYGYNGVTGSHQVITDSPQVVTCFEAGQLYASSFWDCMPCPAV